MKKFSLLLLFFPLLIFSQDNNYSLHFDGVDDYINCGSADNNDILNPGATWMCWINWNGLIDCEDISSCNQAIASKWVSGGESQWGFGLDGDGATNQGVENDSVEVYLTLRALDTGYTPVTGNLFVEEGTWTHIAVVWEEEMFKFYKNGALINSVLNLDLGTNPGATYSLNATSGDLLIGALFEGSQQFFNGKIDDLLIVNNSLSSEEINEYMSCSPTGDEEGVVGYWDFEAGEGQNIYDQSENQNNGINNGAEYNNDTPDQECVSQNESEDSSLVGDVNCDGDITLFDAQMVVSILLEEWDELGVSNYDELLELYPCAGETSTNSNEEALEEVLEIIENINSNQGNVTGFNYAFPDGLNGEGVTWDLIENYQVPTEKTLYITNYYCNGSDGVIRIDGIIVRVGETGTDGQGSGVLNLPLVVNSGQIISSGSESVNFFTGLLVDASNVQGVTHCLSSCGIDIEDSQYSVPEGKRLYINNYHSNASNGKILVDGMIIKQGNSNNGSYSGINLPVIANSNQIISHYGGGRNTFNGYLIDEDYFASQENNSSSSSSSANNNYNSELEYINDILSNNIISEIEYMWPANINVNGNLNDWTYTVPEGKLMHIIDVSFSNYGDWEPLTINSNNNVSISDETSDILFMLESLHSEGTTLSTGNFDNTSNGEDVLQFTYTLIDNIYNFNIEHLHMQDGSTFTVPEGKLMYILDYKSPTSPYNWAFVKFNNSLYGASDNFPTLITGGTEILFQQANGGPGCCSTYIRYVLLNN